MEYRWSRKSGSGRDAEFPFGFHISLYKRSYDSSIDADCLYYCGEMLLGSVIYSRCDLSPLFYLHATCKTYFGEGFGLLRFPYFKPNFPHLVFVCSLFIVGPAFGLSPSKVPLLFGFSVLSISIFLDLMHVSCAPPVVFPCHIHISLSWLEFKYTTLSNV